MDIDFQENMESLYSFAVIVAGDEESWQIANCFNYQPQRKEKYSIRHNGHIAVVTSFPGYTSNAVSTLYEELSSTVRGPIFMIATAVSCKCVEAGLNELISIDTLYAISDEKVELKFYLPKGSEKALPATAVSQCPGKSIPLSQHSKPVVQVLVNLNIPVDSLKHPTEIILLGVNVDKIACQYEAVDVRKSLIGTEHSQALVNAVARFIPTIKLTVDHDVALLLTPPYTSHRKRKHEAFLEGKQVEKFPCHTTTETKKLINKFVQNYLISSLSPKKLKEFAVALGLTGNEYEHIEYDCHYQNATEQIFKIVDKWYEKKGTTDATVENFSAALGQMNHKELQKNLLQLFCYEEYN